jgi:hypothetical protein
MVLKNYLTKQKDRGHCACRQMATKKMQTVRPVCHVVLQGLAPGCKPYTHPHWIKLIESKSKANTTMLPAEADFKLAMLQNLNGK